MPELPGPAGLPVIGSLLPFKRDLLAFLQHTARDHGDLTRFKLGPKPVYFVNDPALIRRVLLDDHLAYRKSEGIQRLRPLIGNGIVALEPPAWQRSRRVMQPVFQRAKVAAFAPRFALATDEAITRWLSANTPLFLRDEMMRLTLSVVSRALFDADLTGRLDDVGHAFTAALEHVMAQVQAPVALPNWVPTPQNRRFARARALVQRTVDEIIQSRKSGDTSADDLLSLLLEARDDTGAPLRDTAIRDEIATLLLAGHDTTAYALTWTLYLLARHPDMEQALAAAVGEEFADTLPAADTVERVPLLGQVIHEALRLYPPSWGLARVPIQDVELSGRTIPAGSMVLMAPYVLHRTAKHWPEPERFDPSRFSGDVVKHEAYLPFGVGPRTCLGQHFATLELRVALATILRRVRVELRDRSPVQAQAGITLRPSRPMAVTVRARD